MFPASASPAKGLVQPRNVERTAMRVADAAWGKEGKRLAIVLCAATFVASQASNVNAVPIVDFEANTLPLGSRYGESHGDHPGDVILTTPDGIEVSLEPFHVGDDVDFFQAEVGGRFAKYFDTTPLELDNISIVADFTSLSFAVEVVTFEFLEFGGWINLGANGQVPLQRRHLVDLPLILTTDIQASVQGNLMTIRAINNAAIEQLLVGGQELVLDNIVALPDPTTVTLLGIGFAFLTSTGRSRRSARCAIRAE